MKKVVDFVGMTGEVCDLVIAFVAGGEGERRRGMGRSTIAHVS